MQLNAGCIHQAAIIALETVLSHTSGRNVATTIAKWLHSHWMAVWCDGLNFSLFIKSHEPFIVNDESQLPNTYQNQCLLWSNT
jgi:hypothetical protein